MVSPRRLFVDGCALSAGFSLVVLGSVLLDPTIWLDDYRPDVKAAVGDSIRQPRGLQAYVGVLLLVVIIGGLIWSLRKLDGELYGIWVSGSQHPRLLDVLDRQPGRRIGR